MSELNIQEIVLRTLPTINFFEYDKLLAEAKQIAEFVSQIEVTEENVKESKKLLANLNKSMATLNRRRIDVKNEILKPYEEFAEKVKHIETIVKDADQIVRDQVREMEEKERSEKESVLEGLWSNRIKHYEHAKVMEFTDWLEPKHLNKTQTVKKSETEMTEFLEKCERDIATLASMEHSGELIAEYKEIKDVSLAIQMITNRKQRISEQRHVLETAGVTEEETFLFVITGEKDRKLTELLLKENNIEFTVRSANEWN